MGGKETEDRKEDDVTSLAWTVWEDTNERAQKVHDEWGIGLKVRLDKIYNHLAGSDAIKAETGS